LGIKGTRAVRVKRGGGSKNIGGICEKIPTNKADITEHVNIQKQVTTQT
jgi:hypothetical protein